MSELRLPARLRRHRSTGSTPSLRSLRAPEEKETQTTAAAWPEDDDVVLVNR